MKKYIYTLSLIFSTISCVSTHPDLNEGLYAEIKTNKGDMVINLASMPVKESGMVNTLKISEVK